MNDRGAGARRRQMWWPAAAALAAVAGLAAAPVATPSPPPAKPRAGDQLPDASGARFVSVRARAAAAATVTVLTRAVATKESGPAETVVRFGEVYSFSPSFIAVRRDVPTRLTFWNLQPDDAHDFLLRDTHGATLLHLTLPPLRRTSYVFTFHRDGLYPFACTLHQPEMSGQILVLPPQ